MRYKGRSKSDNVDDRTVPRKIRKTSVEMANGNSVDAAEAIKSGKMTWDDYERYITKAVPSSKSDTADRLGQRIVLINSAKKTNANADSKRALKAPEIIQLPRKRPSQTYVEAPKPRPKPRRFRNKVVVLK